MIKMNLIRKLLEKPFILITGVLLMILVIVWITGRGKNTDPAQIKEGQIQIVKGDEVVTINQNGLVEYRSKDKTYYETWDTSQINTFFSLMERKARDYLSKRSSGGDCGYKIFMFIDKKLVSICVDLSDEDMANTIELVLIKYSDISLTDYFGDDESPQDEDGEFDGIINFPTSTPSLIGVTPTPTTFSIYNINTNYAPVKADCETWGGSIVGSRAIISNTFCTVDATPTPSL